MGEILLLYQVMMVLLPTESEPVIYVIRKLYMYEDCSEIIETFPLILLVKKINH